MGKKKGKGKQTSESDSQTVPSTSQPSQPPSQLQPSQPVAAAGKGESEGRGKGRGGKGKQISETKSDSQPSQPPSQVQLQPQPSQPQPSQPVAAAGKGESEARGKGRGGKGKQISETKSDSQPSQPPSQVQLQPQPSQPQPSQPVAAAGKGESEARGKGRGGKGKQISETKSDSQPSQPPSQVQLQPQPSQPQPSQPVAAAGKGESEARGKGRGGKGKQISETKSDSQPSQPPSQVQLQPQPSQPQPSQPVAAAGKGESEARGKGRGGKGKQISETKSDSQPSQPPSQVQLQPQPSQPQPSQPVAAAGKGESEARGKGRGGKGKQISETKSDSQPLQPQPSQPVAATGKDESGSRGKGRKGKGKQVSESQEQPPIQPSQPSVQPSQPPVQPSQPPVQPLQPPASVPQQPSGRGGRGTGRGQPQQQQQPTTPIESPKETTPPQAAGAWGQRQRAGADVISRPPGLGQQYDASGRDRPIARGRGEPVGRGDGRVPGYGRGQPIGPISPDRSLEQSQKVLAQPGWPIGKEATPPTTTTSPVSAQTVLPPSSTAGRGRGGGRGKGDRGAGGDVRPSTSKEQPPQKQDQKAGDAPPKPEPVKDLPLTIPHRPDLRVGGTRGKPIEVITNHLALTIAPKYDTAIHYDVTITPDKPKRLMRTVWEEFRRINLPNLPIAFDDSKNAYSPRMLNNGQDIAGDVEVAEDVNSRPRPYRVVMKYAAEVNLRALFDYMTTGGRIPVPQEALQCIDVVLRNVSAVRFTRVGRSFFTPPHGQIIQLGDGLEMWHGHFQSAVIGWKPFLNVDVAHKGFPIEQPVVHFMVQLARDNPYYGMRDPTDHTLNFNNDFREAVRKFLKGLKVTYQIPQQSASRRSYRVNGLVDTPDRARFIEENGQQTTVSEYFKKHKNYTIRLPNIPCLHVGPLDRKIYLPAELCTILPGQVINRKLNEIQTSKMVRNAATSTEVRKEKILNSMERANFNADPCVRAFGLSVGNEFERVRARVLNPPELQYARHTTTPSKGTWRASEFRNPEHLDAWTVFNLAPRNIRENEIENFVKTVIRSAKELGMNVAQVTRPYETHQRLTDEQLKNLFSKYKAMKIIFVIISDFETLVYSKVKRAAELAVGCLTQCIKSKTMGRMNPATVGNILLKVNAKLNGMNHTIADISRPPCLKVPCMIMGADVTHPSPDQTDIPSVAAVTASCDANAVFQYNFCWRLQPARQEIITDLESIVKEQLMFFYTKVGQAPQRIIFFRDGVSEGQFKEVMNAEVQAIRNACGKMGSKGSYKPPITFLVVQKRHHTRFFPTKPNESDDRNFNVRAGTVVDTDITHPTYIDYYLVSHASIQGVARPTKYRVLWDDYKMSEDELEALTYYLCHMFSRCTRSVSYPAPTYYAHLAAFRARVYLEGQRMNLENLDFEQGQRVIREELRRGKPMFFV